MRRALITACLLSAALTGSASAQPSRLLMPGVTYERQVQFTLHGPVVIHVIEAPRPAGLYSLQPVSATPSVQGREKLTTIERRLSTDATVAGVNGDLFSPKGHPSGLFLQGGVMATKPLGTRSSLGIDPSGTLSVDQVPFVGDWRGNGPRRGLSGLNEEAGPNGTVLFTPAWGGATPVDRAAVEAVLSPFPAAVPNTNLTGTVTAVLQGGNHPVPPGGAILYARGNAATRLAAESAVGSPLTARAILPSPLSSATSGIGGGPLLVKNGRPVFRANESFASSWLIPRMARTAVGQRADGSILLVAVDGGRAGYSVGMTNFELAQELAGLGAVTAMGLDSGGSTTMAFEGDLLNRPSVKERQIADALVLLYAGVDPLPVADFGSGGLDGTSLAYKLVRPSSVNAVLDGPGGSHVVVDAGQRTPGVYSFAWKGLDSAGHLLPEGRWTWHVSATDDLGRRSEAERAFSFNTTLKGLGVEQSKVTVVLTRPATLTVRISRSNAVLRTLLKRQVDAGTTTVSWNGRLAGGLRAPAGTYGVQATATNQVGTAELNASLRRSK
jgi:flagellar hook assembly protein FlgD